MRDRADECDRTFAGGPTAMPACASTLYLDFLNLFMFLPRLAGQRRR